jgi:cytochrome P450
MSDQPEVITITTYDEARDTYRQKALRQALYDAGEVVMADVLVNLHGAEHRDRRRLENRLFRRETFELYERELFPPIIAETYAPYIEAGRAELVDLGHQLMMNLAALTAGVDRPLGTPEETFHLYDYLMRFIEGATLAHYTGDRDAKRAEVADKLADFDASSCNRRSTVGRRCSTPVTSSPATCSAS